MTPEELIAPTIKELTDHTYQWIEDVIHNNVPAWKIALVELTRSPRLAEKLIGVRIERTTGTSIHLNARLQLITRVYIKNKLVGELKTFIKS